MENIVRESEIIINKYRNYPLDLYGPEAEAHLNLISSKLPSVASALRKMRDSIAEKKMTGPKPVYGEQTEIRKESIDRGIPYAIKMAIMSPIPTNASKLLGDALDDKSARVVFLHGPSGAGKSCAAAWYIENKPGSRFVTASHLVALNEKYPGDRAELYALQRCKILVIDDCGRGGETDLDRRKIGDFICLRADDDLLTICTSLTIPNYGESLKRRAITKFCEKQEIESNY